MKKVIKLTESDLMRLVKRVIKEQNKSDDDFFYKVKPDQSYYYDKDDNVSDIEDGTDMDVEEWDEDDFDNFHNKYPYGERQRTFPNTEDGKRWFKGYSQVHGGKFPVYKRKKNMVDESSFTFGDKIKGKLGKIVGIPETTDDEMRLADDILSVVERGDYEVLDTYTGSHMRPKGHKIKVSLGDGDYIVKIAQERLNPVSGTITYTNVTTPDGEVVNILAKGFTNKLINLIDNSDRGKRFRYPKQ